MSAYFFLLGFTVLRVSGDSTTDFFELCRDMECTPKGLKRVGKSAALCCSFTRYTAARLLAAAREREIDVSLVKNGGLPTLWLRFIRRPALVIGTVAALFLFFASRLFLWEVALEGYERIGEAELRAELAEIGLERGAFLPRLDTDSLTLLLRQRDARIGYATVNVVGTVAFVQIRESEPTPTPLPHSPANLVAKKDGVVLLPMIYEGECLVTIGERVRAGQMLASGVIDSERGGFRLTRAAGQVLARTEEQFAISVPFAYEEKVYTGKVWREVEVAFFGLCGKVFKNTGNMRSGCDIIINEKEFYAGARTLPVGISTVEYHAYEWQTAKRSATDALSLARSDLAERLALESRDRTLLSTATEIVWSDTGVTLLCTATFEEDIGLVSEFSVSDAAQNSQ